MPAWFIRLAGCNLECSFCDTDFSVRAKLTEKEIVDAALSNSPCRNVVITGGEPSLQNLRPLLQLLKKNGCYIAIETNGTQSLLQYRIEGLLNWVTVSPKQLPIEVECFIDEIKLIWPSDIFEQCSAIKAKYYYLQPCDGDMIYSRVEDTVRTVKNNPQWRLSLQNQKILKIQ